MRYFGHFNNLTSESDRGIQSDFKHTDYVWDR